MTLLHFDLRKPVLRTGFRTHILQNSKFFLISNKISTESFQLMILLIIFYIVEIGS